MAAHTLEELLRLPADERAALARALWDSLTDAERERHVEHTARQPSRTGGRASDRRDQSAPVPWHQVRHLMQGGD